MPPEFADSILRVLSAVVDAQVAQRNLLWTIIGLHVLELGALAMLITAVRRRR
jgi:hypothetical protein